MTRSPHLCIVLLAAGRSTRMGGADKLLRPIGGKSLLEDRVETALSTGFDLHLTLPPKDQGPARWEIAKGYPLRTVDCDATPPGMGESLAAVFSSLDSAYDGALVMLADMPDLSSADLLTVADAFDPEKVTRGASAAGQPGHPVLIPQRLFAQMAQLSGDRGAQVLLKQEEVTLIPLPGQHALTDLDTPADWSAYTARLPHQTDS
ncbi:nucleotidyltransferase family protein [Aliiroseovarius crassostreae]|uniref:nucleotidyltransferase family protein n=1 Tax=Aliiroseovarius crassostreae TaxID=154981 RepID=UPI003C7C4AC6